MILTLRLDEESQETFDNLRQRHFPPERNHLAAHVTLFHKLPREEEATVRAGLANAASRQKPFPVRVEGLRFLGAGVAYKLAAPELSALRAKLASAWAPMLSAQDKQTLAPHVTVQNKVGPEEARALFHALQNGFVPWDAQGIGLDLWEYRGGPWEFLQAFPFEA